MRPAGNVCIGIDLGTTNLRVAVWQNGRLDVIPNEHGDRSTPAFVAFTDEERQIGSTALFGAEDNPRNTIFNVKRLIGKQFDDVEIQKDKLRPFEIDFGNSNQLLVKASFRKKATRFHPEEILAMMLGKIKVIAQAHLNQEVHSAVITVPAFFNIRQRQAIKNAGKIADLDVKHIISEPVATALSYSIGKLNDEGPREQNLLVFDIGAGSLSVALIGIQNQVFRVKAVAGDDHLGGEDFDSLLVDWCIKEFSKENSKEEAKEEVRLSHGALRRLRTKVESAKRLLSVATQAHIKVDELHLGKNFHALITRSKFEEMCRCFFRKCIPYIEKVLCEAGTCKGYVDGVIMVGGSSRIPRLKQLVAGFFEEKQLFTKINIDESVVFGAAIQGAHIAGVQNNNIRNITICDALNIFVEVALPSGKNRVLFNGNTTIPTNMVRAISTEAQNQTTISVQLLERDKHTLDSEVILHKIDFCDLPSPFAGHFWKIYANFAIDADGILEVSAIEHKTGKALKVVIDDEKEFERMCQREKSYPVDSEARQKFRISSCRLRSDD